MPAPPFSPIEDVLADLRGGRMVILTDDERRENEGDLVLPVQHVSPEAITFMLSVARGYMCVCLTEADCDRLDLYPQTSVNTTARGTAFTVTLDGHPRHGFTTGVSAVERASCIKMMIDHTFGPGDFARPGHINPLRSRDGGVLVRTGQTEGSVDLCRLAGLYPAAVIIEIMRDDGEMARVPDLEKIAAKHDLKMCSVAQIIEHRLRRQSLVRRLAPAAGTPIETPEGTFNLITFESMVDPWPHLALTAGDVGRLDDNGEPIDSPEPTLVRVHKRHVLGDIFGEKGSAGDGGSTGRQLHESMRLIQETGRGAIVYMRPEGTGANLSEQLSRIRRPAHDSGADVPDLTHPDSVASSMPADLREYGIGVQILRQLGLSKLRLLTNSKRAIPGLEAFGLEVVEHVPLV
ncbi:MAG: 3,4-dihydroxy-2-butanone-4-phosphate synthase [Phycisphaeraceae bacterium]|nr:MAG: 3,4-dihydroxy-2-butanone-4-phosphate synthase [Phycisphaeraceae bacterium]